MIDRVRKKIDKWKHLNLPKGGRLTLAQSVLNSLPLYFFSILKAPTGVINKIEKLARNFFWNGSCMKGSCNHLVSWEKTALPLHLGGLGIGALKQKSNSMLLKWLWRFTQENEALWRKIIVSIYGEDSLRWSSLPPKGRSKGRPWFDIFKNSSFFSKFLSFKVQRGSHIKFWSDHWIGDSPLQITFPLLFNLSMKKTATVA